jgi:NAD(P)-dependent dehydrogenase (short-subunit alcohol dehydrogenase family)
MAAVLITGTSKGIGLEAALAFGRAGHKVHATMRSPAQSPELEQTAVAQKILEIAEGGTWQLRHPVGPDAAPFLQWRRAMTDEEWVDLNASDDDTWNSRMERDFGLGAKPRN